MINVVIDGNYIFFKTFGVFTGYGEKSSKICLSSEAERNMFMRKVITDLCYSLNQIPDIDRIIFCKDSRSWRKDFKIERSTYKENRVKSEGVDWNEFFKLLEEFGEFLEKNGFIYSRANGAEGDDLIWGWKTHLRKKGGSVLVLSGDHDMDQTVDSDSKGWTCIWNGNSKNNKIKVDENFVLEEENEISIFDVTPTSGSGESKLKKLFDKCKIEKVNTKEFVFKKILTGDDGDNVPTVFPFKTKNGANSGIKEGRANKIWENYITSQWNSKNLEEIWDNEDFLEWLSGLSLRIIAQTDNKENRDLFKKYYKENAILMWLNEKTIPEKVINEIDNHINLCESHSKKLSIIDKKILIEKSSWNGVTAAPKGFDPFDLFK